LSILISSLYSAVGGNQILQRDVLVAVAGVGVLLRHSQSYGLVRAGVYTGQAVLAAAWYVHCPAVLEHHAVRRTHARTYAAADAAVGDGHKLLPQRFRDPAYTAHILPVRGPVLLRDGGDGAFARFDVGGDGRELLW